MKALLPQRGAFALALLLTGCASLAPPATVEQKIAAEAVQRVYWEEITLAGRLSIRYRGPRQDEAMHGSFVWRQTPLHTTVTLLSPLGQTIALIEVRPDGATLIQNGQSTRAAAGVDALTADTLGWPLPVAGLRRWLQGFGVDGHGKHFIATPQDATITTHDGWQIHYATWENQASLSTTHRPKRIDLARLTEQAGNVSLRIVIDTWQTH
ncbi:MAG TPA: lipoprotein insertase outer membrane protein LolB [Noviherbaspirillum sp.]|nr:lipoprotein insertase outer membrane protein LolB [Noviherbaspirillum sp.]